MAKQYDIVYLAPHLDDAVLSCGGQIHDRVQAGERVLVLTIMAGDPPSGLMNDYIAALHERWALAHEATAARRAEDIAAVELLGADYLHWGVPDCIYRGQPAYYVGDPAIFGPIHPAESGLIDELKGLLAGLTAKLIVAPLAAGNHVDHQLVRAAAEAQFGSRLIYYEDYPYVQDDGELARILANRAEWTAQTMPVTPAGYQAKVEAIYKYQSQLSTFFVDKSDLESQVYGYMNEVGGERLWYRQ